MTVNTGKTVENHIKSIVDCSLDNLHYVNSREEDIEQNTPRPLIVCHSQTSGIDNLNTRDIQATRRFDIYLAIFDKPNKRGIDRTGKKTTRESLSSVNLKDGDTREEMIGIVEQIIFYLNSTEFPFCYEIEGDIDFSNIMEDETKYGDIGIEGIFTVAKKYKRKKCCVTFDEQKLKKLRFG